MPTSKALLSLMCTAGLVGCTIGQSATPIDIANVFSVKSTFGPDFQVVTTGPSGIDPKFLAPQTLPDGVTFQPADCTQYADGQSLPAGVKGNMAAVSAEGQGNRFIAIAVETSERVPFDAVSDNCKQVTFAGGNMRGVVEVVEAPNIDGAHTMGTYRMIQTAVGSGELYNYVAYLDDYLVLVTANPLVLPNAPVVPVDTARARELLTAAVAAVRE